MSKAERGLSTLSIASALKLARALAVDVAQLFSPHTEAGESLFDLRRPAPAHRARATLAGGEVLAADMAGKQMQPFVLHPPAEFSDFAWRRPAIRARNCVGVER